MLYVPEKYKNYKYIVSASDNYIILTDVSSAGGAERYEEIDVIYQYINPPLTVETTRQVWSDISYSKIETSSEFFERPDASNILLCVFFLVFLTITVINLVTEFVEKNGIFGHIF